MAKLNGYQFDTVDYWREEIRQNMGLREIYLLALENIMKNHPQENSYYKEIMLDIIDKISSLNTLIEYNRDQFDIVSKRNESNGD